MMKDRSAKLRGVISNEIRMAGNNPMTMARFMDLALLHPEFGYYSTKDRIFNKGGDFTTSPEISQMFGEMLGIWLLTALKNYGDKANDQLPTDLHSINLVEIGPGTGAMMVDILRVSNFILIN